MPVWRNPCIDCRMLLLRKARERMEATGADFVVTGEVLGQRPMSQRREAMAKIDREAGVEGLVVRPLCAKLLEPTIPEREGLIDREKLKGIRGRSRKGQIALFASNCMGCVCAAWRPAPCIFARLVCVLTCGEHHWWAPMRML